MRRPVRRYQGAEQNVAVEHDAHSSAARPLQSLIDDCRDVVGREVSVLLLCFLGGELEGASLDGFFDETRQLALPAASLAGQELTQSIIRGV